MKKIIYILMSMLFGVSCNYLDFDETSNLYTRENMYEYFSRSSQMLTNVYRYMPQDFGAIDGAMRDCASDDAKYAHPTGNIQNFNNGQWSSNNTIDDQWGSNGLYWGIRSANEFLESIEGKDFKRFENDTDYDNWVKKLKYFPYEARVLRAHFFFELARRYGDIGMPLTMLTSESANTLPKTTFADAINFIVDECTACAEELPLNYDNEPDAEFGRITRGFALAVKSKALLYAASKFHNPDMNTDKWKSSARAAKEIMDLNAYSLDSKGVISGDDLSSAEIVMVRMNNLNSDFELRNFPVRFTEGTRSDLMTATFPTQNLVDAFQTKSGYSVTLTDRGWECDDPLFNTLTPYFNRDPRFERTILANGMAFKGGVIETYKGGKDDVEVSLGGTSTGYFLRKYIQEQTSFVLDQEIAYRHHWVVYRYAETLLTYAESMVEAFGSATYTDSEFPLSALNALNEVRANAQMPYVSDQDKETFVNTLRNEWRVEFAFEDHRFWDIRRWDIGAQTQTVIYGIEATMLTSGFTSYKRVLCDMRVWNRRMNLYPIPQDELFNNKNLMPQNQGW